MSKRLCPKVAIVEEDAELRSSLVCQLETDGLKTRAFESGEAFLASWSREDEGCVVIDVHLPGISGLEVLKRLSQLGSRLVPIVMTGRGDVTMAVQAMRAGANDFIEKPFVPGVFRSSVLTALNMAERLVPLQRDIDEALAKHRSLSEREQEVFAGLVDGRQGKQIAMDLGISPRTVEIHRARIMEKIHATSFSDLLRLGMILEINRRMEPHPVMWAAGLTHTHQKRPF